MADVVDRPDPLAVLRRKAKFASFAAKDEFDAALAQVEALVEAAHTLADGMVELRTLPGCMGTIDATSVVALRDALVLFPRKERT